jgi:hypothetical protein
VYYHGSGQAWQLHFVFGWYTTATSRRCHAFDSVSHETGHFALVGYFKSLEISA